MIRKWNTILLFLLAWSGSLLQANCCINTTPTTTYSVTANAVAFSPTANNCFTIGDTSGHVSTYSLTSSCTYATSPTSVFSTGGIPISSLAYSQEGCLAAGYDSQASVFHPLSAGSCDYSMQPTHIMGLTGAVAAAAFSPSNCLALGLTGSNGTVNVYAEPTPTTCTYNTTPTTTPMTGSGPISVTAVTFSSGACLIVGDSIGNVTIFPQTTTCSYVTAGFSQRITLGGAIKALAVSSTGCLAVADSSGIITIYAPDGSNCTYTTPAATTITAAATPTTLAFSPTSSCLLVGDSAGNINSYSNTSACTYSTSPMNIITGTGSPITALAYSAAGCLAAAFDSVVNIYGPTPIAVTITPPSLAVCTGATIGLTANATGGSGTYSYAWTGPNAFTATTQSISIPNATSANAGTYMVTVTDSNNCTGSASAPVTVNPDPTANSASFATCENTAFSGTLTSTCTGCTVTSYTIVSAPAHGMVMLTNPSTGAYTYTPNSGFAGSDSFTFTAINNFGCVSNIATISITVNPAPTANSTSFDICENTSFSGTLTSTCTGCTVSSYSIVTLPAHGLVTLTNPSTGAYTYTPNSGYTGPDSFTFTATATNACVSNTATVSITVNPAATANSASFNACMNTAFSDTLTSTCTGCTVTSYTIVTPPAHGTAIITNPSTGAFTYTPTSGYSGPDSFTFTATDNFGCVSNTATISIAVNPNPIANSASFDTCENTPFSNTLTSTCTGCTVTAYTIVTPPAHGTATITNPSTGAFTYTPTSGYSGPDSFTFEATSSAGCISNIATITLLVNAGPTVTVSPPSQTICNNATFTITSTPTGGTTPYSFSWTGPNGFTATTQNITVINATPADTGTYTLVVTGFDGCSSLPASATVTVEQISVTITPSSVTANIGTNVTLTANPSGGSGSYGFSWTGPNGFTATGNPISIPITANTSFGMYTVTVTDLTGCAASGSANAMLLIKPVITSPTGGSMHNPVTVTGVAPAGAVVTVFANGVAVATTVADPNGNYSVVLPALAPGTYVITVEVDELGTIVFSDPVTITILSTRGVQSGLSSAIINKYCPSTAG